jgi:hypothetical protein
MKQAPLGEQAGDLGDVGERGAGLVVRGSAVISSGGNEHPGAASQHLTS